MTLKNSLLTFSISLSILGGGHVYGNTSHLKVNQVGYIPSFKKVAVYASPQNTPLDWVLWKGDKPVSQGQTVYVGPDSSSGENIHQIDFSHIKTVGTNYKLKVGDTLSYPFAIDSNLYTQMQYDALKYFYHNRSGIEIETQYTGGGNTSYAPQKAWARPAGHLNKGKNTGDFKVPCWEGTCDYTLDVPYGWYDAGDHGKYVVNGGISVWKLLNLYERALYVGKNIDQFADGTLNIPESKNGVSDLLDEVRWQMQFMLSMQIPQGKPHEGMVHHKIQDFGWTSLPMPPHQDPQQRVLVPPTTGATLNVAANAAQCARIWKEIDPGFAKQCLVAAKTAFAAAKANPKMYTEDKYNNGGGGYGDNDFSDEFHWAAAELYITTGEETYKNDITLNTDKTAFNWGNTTIPGLMSLSIVPTPHTQKIKNKARKAIIDIAESRTKLAMQHGYLIVLKDNEIGWGSTNDMVNILSAIGLAYDFTGNALYLDTVSTGMNYLLGTNALSISYVTGHGENPVKQPHHRFWAGAIDKNYPWVPPGAMSGGPNYGIQDPIAQKYLKNCVPHPQTCFVDHIESWSTNEITINWNSAFAWILAFYVDHASREQ